MTQAVHAFGSKLEVETGTPGVYDTIAEITNLSTNVTSDELDVTNHDGASRFREFIQGLKQMEVSLEGNYLPNDPTHDLTADTGMLGLYNEGTLKHWRIVFPVTPTVRWKFLGFVREFSPSMNVDEKLSWTASIRVSGSIDFDN